MGGEAKKLKKEGAVGVVPVQGGDPAEAFRADPARDAFRAPSARFRAPEAIAYPSGHVLQRKFAQEFPLAVRAEGVRIFDRSGRDYIDGSSGAYVCSVGHSHPTVIARMVAQLERVSYLNGTQFANEATEELAAKIISLCPEGVFDKCFFMSSGSEALEASVKFARQYWVGRGQIAKRKIISQSPSYHGNTLFALSVSDRPSYKSFFAPLLSETFWVKAPMKARFSERHPGKTYKNHGADVYLKELKALLEKEDPRTISCFVVEPVGGSSTGGSVAPPGYWKAVQKLCRENDILLIADEVLVGAGRTGTFLASEQEGFAPDIAVLAKGLNGGYAPLSALLVRQELSDEMAKEAASFMHAQTFLNHPLSSAAALGVLKVFQKESVLGEVQQKADLFREYLIGLERSFDFLAYVEGRGLLGSVEIVRPDGSKEPFSVQEKMSQKACKLLKEEGVIAWPNSGHLGSSGAPGPGDHIIFAPPLTITDDELAVMFARVRRGLERFAKSLNQS